MKLYFIFLVNNNSHNFSEGLLIRLLFSPTDINITSSIPIWSLLQANWLRLGHRSEINTLIGEQLVTSPLWNLKDEKMASGNS